MSPSLFTDAELEVCRKAELSTAARLSERWKLPEPGCLRDGNTGVLRLSMVSMAVEYTPVYSSCGAGLLHNCNKE